MRALVLAVLLLTGTMGARAEDLGQAIYFGRATGLPAGQIGGIAQRDVTCAGCHGRDAGGGGEGRSRIPAIHGAALRSVTAERPAYDPASFRRALVEGRDSAGRSLSIAMPRFALSSPQVDALWRYLEGVGARDRAGVSSDRVKIGLPASSRDDPAAQQLLDQLSARWRERGEPPIHGRKVEFVVVPVDGLASVTDVTTAPFVLVGPVLDREGKALAILRQAGLPVLAPRGTLPAGDLPADIVPVRAGDREIVEALLGLADARTSIIADQAVSIQSASAPATLSPEASLPANAQRIVLLVGEPGLRAFVSAHRLGVAGRTVVLPMSLVEARPDLAGELLAAAATVVAARPSGDPSDVAAYAAMLVRLLETVLIEAGRDLTRTGFLNALRTARVRGTAWPEIDFQRHPRTGTAEVEFVRVSR